MLFAWNVNPGSAAVIQITAFHFQSIYILLLGGIQWHLVTLNFLRGATSTSSLSIYGVECLIPGWNVLMYLLVFVCLPLVFAVLGFCAAAISAGYHSIKGKFHKLEKGYFKTRIKKVIAVLCGLGYSTIVVSILQMFGCTSEDKLTNTHYLIAYPWIACTHRHWDKYLVFAVFGFLFEVIGLPLFLWTRMRMRDREEIKQVYASFYNVYTPKRYYWEFVVIARRFGLAVIVAIVPYTSPLMLVGFVLLVLAYMMLQTRANPYVRPIDNILDFVSHFVLLATLFIGLLTNVPILHGGWALSLTAALLNGIFVLMSTACIVSHYSRVTIVGLRKFLRRGKKKVEPENKPLLSPTINS
eukprot:Phypoly_transcript_11506.p1 GENE.Phypoly_transcript_11506~~Phypoly_transcript_11506.p1  ORF type:complete len:355 (+),score=36.67 Phypoly_transcript_11506:88-1152(+)